METEFAVSLGSQRWTLPADGDTITIGRGSNADIRLPSDDQISRIHARLNRSGTTWTLVDESRNGTALNGRRLAAPTQLTDNDRIQIGRSVLTFHKPTGSGPDQSRPQTPLSGQPDGAAPATGPAGAASAAGSAGAASAAGSAGAASAAGLATGAAAAAGSAGAGSAGSASPTPAPSSRPEPGPGAAGLAAGGPSSTPPPASTPRQPAGSTPSPADAGAPASAAGRAASGPASTPTPAHTPSPPPQAAPGTTPAQAGPGGTPAQGGPGAVPAHTAPGTTPAQAGLGGAPAHTGPGTTPAHTGPGTTPAQGGPGGAATHTSPGTTPAQAGPGGTPSLAGPGAQGGPSGTPGTHPRTGPGGSTGTRAEAGSGAAAGATATAHGGSVGDSGAAAQAGAVGGAGAAAPSSSADAPGNSPFRDSASGFDAGPVDNRPFWSEPTPGTPADSAPPWPVRGVEQPAASRASTEQGAADARTGRAGQDAPHDGNSPSWPQSDPDFHDQIIGGPQAPWATDLPDSAHPDAGSDEWIGGAQVGWVDPADAGSGGAAWAAYPSADNPEPARSPWSSTKRPALSQPEGGQANWSESSGWPDSAFEQQEPQNPPAREPEPVRRKPAATEDAPAGHVRLIRVLLVAGAVLGLGLVINLVATFFADGAGGTLRWLVPPAIALIAAMVVALLDAVSSEDRPDGGRLDVPVIVAIVAVLLGVGVGGFALTAGVEYFAGYITGKESGEDRLIKPVAKTTAGLTITVENVTYTSHFTRVEVAVSNGGDQSLSLPLEGNAAFTGADGNSLKADGFRSQWNDSIAAGSVEHGTITFKGHLPEGLTDATLTLKSGDAAITVPGLALSN